MTQPFIPPDVAIGACLNHRQIYLVVGPDSTCLVCGRPPDLALPFLPAGGAATAREVLPEGAAAPPAEPILVRVTCPHCAGSVPLRLDDDGLAVLPTEASDTPALAPEEMREPTFAMYAGAFLAFDEGVGEEDLHRKLMDLGADPEMAATAVGRLRAIRDALASLDGTANADTLEPPGGVPLAAPPPAAPAEEPAGAGAPPPPAASPPESTQIPDDATLVEIPTVTNLPPDEPTP